MFNSKTLRLSSIISISLSICLCSVDSLDLKVLSPNQFDVILSPNESGTLLNIRININRQFGIGEEPSYQKENVTGRVVHFSERSLNLKRGDIIYYSITFADGNQGFHGQDGNYIFDGVYKRRDRRRREVYEQSSEENSEEKSVNQNIEPKESRYLRHGHGPPHGHYNPRGPPHHHFGPHHFFPPPFGVPHHPSPFPGPGSWKDDGYDRKDRFGNNGPWDGHRDDDDCDSFGNKPRYPDGRKPWHGEHGDNPYGNKNDGNNGFGGKPSKGSGSGGDEGSDSGKTDNNNNNKGSENPNVEIFTTRKPSTTPRTTTVPNIDIRYRIPEDR